MSVPRYPCLECGVRWRQGGWAGKYCATCAPRHGLSLKAWRRQQIRTRATRALPRVPEHQLRPRPPIEKVIGRRVLASTGRVIDPGRVFWVVWDGA